MACLPDLHQQHGFKKVVETNGNSSSHFRNVGHDTRNVDGATQQQSSAVDWLARSHPPTLCLPTPSLPLPLPRSSFSVQLPSDTDVSTLLPLLRFALFRCSLSLALIYAVYNWIKSVLLLSNCAFLLCIHYSNKSNEQRIFYVERREEADTIEARKMRLWLTDDDL